MGIKRHKYLVSARKLKYKRRQNDLWMSDNIAHPENIPSQHVAILVILILTEIFICVLKSLMLSHKAQLDKA